MNETELKQEILATRVGGFGSSDAKMIAEIGRTGEVSDSAKYRIAQMLGIEPVPTYTNWYMENGKMREQQFFEYMADNLDIGCKINSNPYIEYTDPDFPFKIFSHIDIEIDDDVAIEWFEVKTTKNSLLETMENYKEQLAWHYMILAEKAELEGKTFSLYLTKYKEDYANHSEEFDCDKLTRIRTTKITCPEIDTIYDYFMNGFKIIAEILPTFAENYKKREVLEDAMLTSDEEDFYLDLQVRIAAIKELEREIKEIEKPLEAYKNAKLEELKSGGYKGYSNRFIKATYVKSTNTSLDKKLLEQEQPEIYKQYLQTSTKEYLKLTINKEQ